MLFYLNNRVNILNNIQQTFNQLNLTKFNHQYLSDGISNMPSIIIAPVIVFLKTHVLLTWPK